MHALVAWSIPALFAALALLPADLRVRAAGGAPLLPLAAALGIGGAVAFAPAPITGLGVRLDVVSAVMLGLVTTVALVIARYARTALTGDPRRATHLRWLYATLAGVTTLVVADHLAVVAVAWTATSLCLHPLLTHYAERPGAQLAAHKKFLVSRVADLCLVGGLLLLHAGAGTLSLTELATVGGLADSPAAQVAALLLVAAVALRSAQLPFHGWLTQVMEAPTPVSALLHAGVINVGGFLLIRLAPVMAQAPAASLALVVVGTATAVVAGLVLQTRPTVKVALAWSTCAQMGFMLAECGVGAWPLALVHLVGHSLYKAHAFLGAGGTVARWVRRPVTVPVGALAARGGLVVAGYLVLHAALDGVGGHAATGMGWGILGVGLVGATLLGHRLAVRPEGRLARRLLPRLAAGLHLDDHVTRLALRVWPLPTPAAPPVPARATLEIS